MNAGQSFQRFFNALLPPPEWRLAAIILFGALLGLTGVLFHVSRAASYLSDDPATCVNCHVMAPQYATWARSAHRLAATCNDCHVPHDNFVRHYFFKAMDGMRHATIFTLRLEPQVIHIKRMGQVAVQENCIRCHNTLVHMVGLQRVRGDDTGHEEGFRCWDCHRETPHGRVNSLAAVPYEHVPLPGPVTPAWLRRHLDQPPGLQPEE